MPLKWFRSHRDSTEDEATRSSTETKAPKQKAKRNKSVTQRSRRSQSQGTGLRARIGLGGSMQHELDAAAIIAAEEEQRRISYQSKTHRRFTIHGLTYHKHNEEEQWSCNSTPAGSPLPMYASSPSHTHSRHFGIGSGRMPHGRSPHTQQIPLSPNSHNSHPSIIFIDCPP